MSADIETRVREALAAVADTQTATPDWDDVLARTDTAQPRDRRRWPLVAVAAALVTVAVATYATLASGTSPRRIDVRPSDEPVGETTTTLDPTTGVGLDVGWDSLPEWGIVVRTDEGTMSLLDQTGSLRAAGSGPEFSTTAGVNGPITGTGAELSVVVVPDGSGKANLLARGTSAEAAPPGCDQPMGYGLAPSAAGPDASYSVCGRDARQIWVTHDGVTSTLTGPPSWPTGSATPAIGHWTAVEPSPDGAWLLAQWSGECEMPTAFLVPTAGGVPKEAAPANEDRSGSFRETIHHGWTPEGRAIIEVPTPMCGAAILQSPGVFVIPPDVEGTVETIVWLPDGTRPMVWTWRKAH